MIKVKIIILVWVFNVLVFEIYFVVFFLFKVMNERKLVIKNNI